MNRGVPRSFRNAILIDKPSVRFGMRSLSLRGGARRPGRLRWYGEYPSIDDMAKKMAYQSARDSAAYLRLLIVEERVR